MGHIATSNINIDLSAKEAWKILSDFSLAHNYVPGIDRCTITTEKKSGVGASRRVSGKQQDLEETVTEWNEGKGFVIRLHKGDKAPFPFKSAQFTYRIDALDDKSCKMTTTLIYETGLLGSILHGLGIGSMIRKNIRDVVLSMKHYYETGKATTPEDLKELRKIPEGTLPKPYE